MKKPVLFSAALLIAITGCSEEPAAPAEAAPATNAPAEPATISIKDMLMSGPAGLKLHSLAMISQNKVEVDDSYIPAFKVCSEDPALPVRSITAQQIGKQLIQGNPSPNPEAINLLVKLSRDESEDVRYNAVYYGLTQIQNKSEAILERLIEVAASERKPTLFDRIVESLKDDRERVARLLDKKLAGGDNVAMYEIYEDLTGMKPPNADKYLDMPSSRPRLFIFSGKGGDPASDKAELEKALKQAGIENPNILIADEDKENYLLMIKTYITGDHVAVEKAFENHPRFKITHNLWLTPEDEAWVESTQKK